MRFLIAAVALLAAAPLSPQGATERESFEVRYLYDEDQSSLSFVDLRFASPEHGLAVGALSRNGRIDSRGALTVDGGKTWELVDVPKNAATLFFLDESHAWIAASDGIHFSADGGRRWKRLSRLRNPVGVHFLDPQRGFAAGFDKKVWRTVNGGRNWTEVETVSELPADPKRSVFTLIDFINPRDGFIVGYHVPRRDQPRFPDWMTPESSRRRRQLPSLSLMLQTVDGGETWKASAASIMGRITRHRGIPGGRRVSLVEYEQGFDWPSEVFRTNGPTDTESAFREKNLAVTDVALLPDGSGILAGYEPAGALARLPVPGKVRVRRSSDLVKWEPVAVDYRAVAQRVHLAIAPGGGVWAATDSGTILELVRR